MEANEMITFKTAFKGYEKESVHRYIQNANETFLLEKQELESVIRNQAYTIESVTAKNEALEAKMQEVEAQRQALYDEASQTLQQAKEQAEQLTKDSHAQAAELTERTASETAQLRSETDAHVAALRAQAQEEAQKVRNEAQAYADQLIADAKAQADAIGEKAQAFLQAQMSALEHAFAQFGAKLREKVEVETANLQKDAQDFSQTMVQKLQDEMKDFQ